MKLLDEDEVPDHVLEEVIVLREKILDILKQPSTSKEFSVMMNALIGAIGNLVLQGIVMNKDNPVAIGEIIKMAFSVSPILTESLMEHVVDENDN